MPKFIIPLCFILLYGHLNASYAQKTFSDSTLIPFEDHGKWGYYDRNKNVIIKPSFEDADFFDKGVAVVVNKSVTCFMDPKGKISKRESEIVFETESDNEEALNAQKRKDYDENNDNKLAELKNGYWGGINPKTKKILIPHIYEQILSIKKGQAIVKLNNKWGVVDTIGNTIYPNDYNEIVSFDKYDYYYLLKDKDSNQMLGDFKGRILIQYPVLVDVNEKYSIVKLKDSTGVVDIHSNKMLVPAKYRHIKFTEKGDFLLVDFKMKFGVANKNGKIIIPIKYRYIINAKYDFYEIQDSNKRKGYYSRDGVSYFKE